MKSAALGSTGGVRAGLGVAMTIAGVIAWGAVAHAQQINGVPGSPSATINIDGRQLPPPPTRFGGVIGERATESKPYWPPAVVPPKGAPNVLLIMTDDVGFGAPSTFGGVIPTPALDRIAKAGLRYTQFHSTALCSPTRAALITGRNHHSVGFGVISERRHRLSRATTRSSRRRTAPSARSCGRTATRRRGSARTTTRRPWIASQAGPFDQWPTGMGFEYFYGFIGGDTSQWQPNLFRNTTAIYPFRRQARLEPDDRHGGRRDPAHEAAERARAGQALLRLLRAGRHACAASPDAGVDQEDQRQKLFDNGWNALRETHLREPEAARRDSAECQADPVAGRPAALGLAVAGTRRSCSSARSMCTRRTSPTPTTRSAASSRRSRTWASSTTR